MSAGPRVRFRVEVALAALSACFFVAVLVLPDWIEVVFGIDPDGGAGALEVLISVVSLTVSLGLAVLARVEHHRGRSQADHA
jgi:hypothetical protein